MTIKEYPPEVLNGQPLGAWTGEAYRRVVGAIRSELAVEGLAQPHWWTLNHAAGAPGRWTRTELASRLAAWEDLGLDFDAVFDDLVGRGWLVDDGGLTLTADGEAGRLRAKERLGPVLARTREGVDPDDFVTTINVLRRVVANLGGDGDLPA
ncbi:MarR family transcriptional regulator [Herbidospora sp. RD11066]